MLPQKVIGIEQIGDKQINHTTKDLRPVVVYLLWAAMMLAVLLVATSCEDGGMYQGPNDNSPRYGGPK